MTTVETAPTGTDKKDKVVRPEFNVKKAVDAAGKAIKLNDKDQLTAVPANWSKDSLPLQRRHFATKMLQLQHQKAQAEGSVVRAQARVDTMEQLIVEERDGVDPIKKKQDRIEKLRGELEKLESQLKDEGVSTKKK